MGWIEKHIFRSKSSGDVKYGKIISNPVLRDPLSHAFPTRQLQPLSGQARPSRQSGDSDARASSLASSSYSHYSSSSSISVDVVPDHASKGVALAGQSPPLRPPRTYEPSEVKIPTRQPVPPSLDNPPAKDVELPRRRKYRPVSKWPPKALKERRMIEPELVLGSPPLHGSTSGSNTVAVPATKALQMSEPGKGKRKEKLKRTLSKSVPNTPKHISLKRGPAPMTHIPMHPTTQPPLSAGLWASRIETPSLMHSSRGRPALSASNIEPFPSPLRSEKSMTKKLRKAMPSSRSHGNLRDLGITKGLPPSAMRAHCPRQQLQKPPEFPQRRRYGPMGYGGRVASVESSRSDVHRQPGASNTIYQRQTIAPRTRGHMRHISLNKNDTPRAPYITNPPPLERPPPNSPLLPLPTPPDAAPAFPSPSRLAAMARRGSCEALTLRRVSVNTSRAMRGRSLESLKSPRASQDGAVAFATTTTPASEFYVFSPLELLSDEEKGAVPKALNLNKANRSPVHDMKHTRPVDKDDANIYATKVVNCHSNKNISANTVSDRNSLEVPLTIDHNVHRAIVESLGSSPVTSPRKEEGRMRRDESPSSAYPNHDIDFEFWIEMGLLVEPKSKTSSGSSKNNKLISKPISRSKSPSRRTSRNSGGNSGHTVNTGSGDSTREAGIRFLRGLRGHMMVYAVTPITHFVTPPPGPLHHPPESGWVLYDDVWAGSTTTTNHQRHGVVFKSQPCLFSEDYWERQLESAWKVLGSRMYSVLASSQSSVGTHIYINPVSTFWTLFEIKAIAKSAIYFERAIDSLDMSISGILGEIEAARGEREVIELICPSDWAVERGTAGSPGMIASFCYTWDFTNVTRDVRGGIGFRRPPGCLKKGQAEAWTRFAVGFTKAAITVGNRAEFVDLGMIGDLERLKAFVDIGMEMIGVEEEKRKDVASNIFDGPMSKGKGKLWHIFPLSVMTSQSIADSIASDISSTDPASNFPEDVDPSTLKGFELQLQRKHANTRSIVVPSVGHPVFTVALGARESSSVLVPDFTVHGVKGLSVADNSIMPLLPGTHTSSTAYMIGEEAAELGLGRWTGAEE
ncbi:hypothetical protein MKZ38_002727 [Zalerion maritima]|uniref:Glucose-methanol-choline oxidoreductase C-terminal domain-containing protein n=1 Tax=Zalerion maritima TaxID=339359 RepID=A0AAD5WR24_9PEZI|nr:hypothetical protein MKZ38_002727 [Zalerion maritima]